MSCKAFRGRCVRLVCFVVLFPYTFTRPLGLEGRRQYKEGLRHCLVIFENGREKRWGCFWEYCWGCRRRCQEIIHRLYGLQISSAALYLPTPLHGEMNNPRRLNYIEAILFVFS